MIKYKDLQNIKFVTCRDFIYTMVCKLQAMYTSQDLQGVFTLHLFQGYLLRKAIDYHNSEFVQVTTLYPTHPGHIDQIEDSTKRFLS